MYTIIGNGRMANHMAHYLTSLNIPYIQWHRRAGTSLAECLAPSQHALLLISDKAIEPFVQENAALLENHSKVHFSAALDTPLAHSAHPLMTFAEKLYSPETYQQIPFILSDDALTFADLLPGLPNPHFQIPADKRAYYHALCVMANNFTTLLWQRFFNELQQELQLPESAGKLYLEQTFSNLRQNPHTALTGPLARGDRVTIEKNQQALSNDPFSAVYQAFVETYPKINTAEAL